MKNIKIFNIAAAVALAVGAASCSSDYLDLEPEVNVIYSDGLTNSQGATLATHGLCGMMYKQYASLYDYNWFNGEPWLSMYYGEVVGQDYISLFWIQYSPYIVNWTDMNRQSQGAQVAWAYCYELIAQANNIISFAPKQHDSNGNVVVNSQGNEVPDFSEDVNPRLYAFRYAQALTMRAHAYSRLMQIYAPRWDDRMGPDGELGTVPLRLKYVEPEGNMDCPLSPMSEVMDQIYADLDQALELYQQSGMNRSYDWEPDMQIAQGVYARAALLKNDYPTAQQMAHDARQGYTIMSSEDYQAGFAKPTSEWMWCDSGESKDIYFASFGASYACNGAYPCIWGVIGAGAIDNDLMNLSELQDQRTPLFFSPKNVLGTPNKAKFWGDGCDQSTMNINGANSPLHEDFVDFASKRYAKVSHNGWLPPYTYRGQPNPTVNSVYTSCAAQFGAQFKFWGTDGYSTSYFPFMRASEMLLIEAEAAWWNDDNATALSLLNQLNSMRVLNYRNQNYSGEELLEKIKICRRLELWGEGFNWFDFKRWKQPIVRRAWEKGQLDSGNWPANVADVYDVDLNRGWRWRIPSTEYNYNHAIDQSEANAN